MVVKMMRWRPWPPLLSKKFEVKLTVQKLDGLLINGDDLVHEGAGGLAVEIKWKGPKIALSTFRRTTLTKNCTRAENVVVVGQNGVVQWDEEFQSVCNLSGYKDNVFYPWEITFTVLSNGLTQGSKNKLSIIGTAMLNLAEFAAKTEEKEFQLQIPLAVSVRAPESCPTLSISISLLELRAAHESTESVQIPVVSSSSLGASGETPSTEKDELSALKAGLRKVKILKEFVSSRRAKKACREEEGSESRCSRSEEGEYAYPFDSDLLDESEEGEMSDASKEDSSVRKSFSYGTLAYANCVGGSFYSSTRLNGVDEDWIYYSSRRSDVGCSRVEEAIVGSSEPSLVQNQKRSLLPWRKRKLSFRSPKTKGEPLLKKDHGEEGGDDIDFDRRQLSSDESLTIGWHKTDEDSSVHRSSVSEFGDDNFAVGSWEQRDITSRDGQMKVQTQVFFASIDQRSERAAGESACTALVAVFADWLQSNYDLMPIKSQFDSLIREGSLEWRKLCENETYRTQFPDKHFDLETVLQAKIRSISVVPEKSFIGFFHPDEIDEGRFDFLQGAMSFDDIWEEISSSRSESLGDNGPRVFIISWNDHFFVLKVTPEAYYIIDTLGERLYEGCNQAYILKFDRDTTILKLPSTEPSSSSQEKTKTSVDQQLAAGEEPKCSNATLSDETTKSEEEVICRGKESCKEYIKSFLAAIPIRELRDDIKKGLIASTPVHHRLQIEFHFTQLQQPATIMPKTELATVKQQIDEVIVTEVAI